jgi:prevent-host-death family protein
MPLARSKLVLVKIAIFAIVGTFSMIEIAMTIEAPVGPPTKRKVPLTTFHNHTGEYLDLGRRTPVTITKHGRPDITIAEASYFERIERIAAGQILAVLDLSAVDAADMSEEHAAIFDAARPTPQEIAADRWNDDTAS